MLSQTLDKFEIQRYYKNESKFNIVYLRNSLSKIKSEGYEINAEEYKSIGTHKYFCIMIVFWMVLYVNGHNVT